MTTVHPAVPAIGPDLFAAEGDRLRSRLPKVGLPGSPEPGRLFGRCLTVVWVLVAALALDRAAILLMDLWLLESLGYASVFWTNFWTRCFLFGAGFVLVTAAATWPFLGPRPRVGRRRRLLAVSLLIGVTAGWVFSGRYLTFIAWWNGQPYGRDDPVFGHDTGFYLFTLPALREVWLLLMATAAIAVVAAIAAGWRRAAHSPELDGESVRRRLIRASSGRTACAAVAALGVLGAAGLFLARYDVLTADNTASSIPSGAEHLDVSGPFSTVTYLSLSAVVVLVATAVFVGLLRGAGGDRASSGRRRGRRFWLAVAVTSVLVLDLVGFRSALAVRNLVGVRANEPVIQLPYIQRHLEATRTAWGLDDVETVDFTPKADGEPLPSVDRLLQSPTIRNAGLWPGYVSRLERVLDPEYVDRLFLAGPDGFDEIYSTTLDAFKQQQKLRPYYDFMDVDTVRYTADGEARLYASAVREVPLLEPQPWLAWWGQRFVLFTHGFGLVGSELGSADPAGRPAFVSSGIPAGPAAGPMAVANERVYYGEGSGTMAYSNLDRIDELDHPTGQGRQETRLPDDVPAGVVLDSLLKRVVFGWKSGELTSIAFSDLITDSSRVHYFRTPLERLQKVAPFLYFDTDPYAVTSGQTITWMVNGLTTATGYPYSAYADLGDKSDRRSPTSGDPVRVNYAADTVKATVDAYTGRVALYRIADEPVIETWANAYPDLFLPSADMPVTLREQVQYPPQLFHAQFDDLFVYYHVPDAITFFNAEDLWDDADEVVGPILSEGQAVTFSMEPYPWIAETGTTLPGEPGDHTFALSMAFTPENALNLRAIVTAYQNGLDDDYGRLVVLQVPKAEFHFSPEQADAAIDQDSFISQQIGFWNRQGNETVRGHTTPLLVDGELIYVEPIFSRSTQNSAPQLQRVVVVVRGAPFIGLDLEDALRVALDGKAPPGVSDRADPP